MSIIERLGEDVSELVVPGGRLVGSAGHTEAREYLLRRLKEVGLEGYPGDGYESQYEMLGASVVNVLARLPGTNPDLAPIMLVAHYDTCGPYPGADDNAAAIAILLEAVEPLRARNLERSIVFAFFDAEEPPFYLTPAMGSIYFYTHQRTGPIHCTMVLDLCGHDIAVTGLEDLLFVTGMESDPELAEVVKACEPTSGLRTIPTLNRYIGDLSDHHVFRVNRRPYLFLSCGRWPHYHQPSDTPEKLNYAKMAAIVAYVDSLAAEASQHEFVGPFEGYDTIDTELYFLRQTVGPFLEALGFEPRSREDLDVMVQFMTTQFGL